MNQTDQNNQPVLALRDNTERPKTITIGANEHMGPTNQTVPLFFPLVPPPGDGDHLDQTEGAR